ncbi:hypothetical protein HQ531_14045, partial [bacterium]|nr:hypothetical protein [bacterium]
MRTQSTFQGRLFDSGHASSLLVLTFFMVLGGVTSILLGQDNNWDLRNYHIYNAYSFFIERGELDILPAQLQSFFNPLPDIFLLLLIASFKPIMVGFILGLIHGINYFLVFKIAEVLFVEIPSHIISFRSISILITPFKMALLISLAAFIAPSSLNLLGTSYHDNLITIPLFISVLIIIISLKDSQNISTILIFYSGFAAGLAFGIKMTAAVYILASALGLPFVVSGIVKKTRLFSAYSGGVIVGAFITGGFWYLKMWQIYANPFFPWFNNIFKSPELLNLAIRDTRLLPGSVIDGLLYPFYFMYNSQYTFAQGGFRDLRFALLFLMLVIFVIVLFRGRINKIQNLAMSANSKFILLFSIFAYVIWLVQFSIYRYLFMIEALAFLCIAIIIYYYFKS